MKTKKLTKKEKEMYKKFSLFCEKVIEIVNDTTVSRKEIVEGLSDMKEFFLEKTKD